MLLWVRAHLLVSMICSVMDRESLFVRESTPLCKHHSSLDTTLTLYMTVHLSSSAIQAITENVVDVTFVYDAVLQLVKCRWFLRGLYAWSSIAFGNGSIRIDSLPQELRSNLVRFIRTYTYTYTFTYCSVHPHWCPPPPFAHCVHKPTPHAVLVPTRAVVVLTPKQTRLPTLAHLLRPFTRHHRRRRSTPSSTAPCKTQQRRCRAWWPEIGG